MNILIYGGKGWIGGMMTDMLVEKGHTVTLGEARLNDYGAVFNEVLSVAPDRVFTSTGRTHGTFKGKYYGTIDYLELPGGHQLNVRDNQIGPINLAKVCQKLRVHLTYIGTGCIFSYDDTHPMPEPTDNSVPSNEVVKGFTEEDKPNFFGSGYSTVKGQTDVMMRDYPGVLNCRIRMPITGDSNPRNFITKITTYEKICSIPNSMTVLPEILDIISHMMNKKETGTYNLTNPGYITHNQILDMYTEIVDSDFVYKNFTIEEQAKILLSGRSNNYLDTRKLEEYCMKNGLGLDNITVAVRKVLEKWQV